MVTVPGRQNPRGNWLIKAIQHFYVTFHESVPDKEQQYQRCDSFPLRLGQLISAVGAPDGLLR